MYSKPNTFQGIGKLFYFKAGRHWNWMVSIPILFRAVHPKGRSARILRKHLVRIPVVSDTALT